MSPLNPKKILLIKHGSLGDIVFALEPILSIHKKFNNSVIDLVTEEKFIPFFKLLIIGLPSHEIPLPIFSIINNFEI